MKYALSVARPIQSKTAMKIDERNYKSSAVGLIQARTGIAFTIYAVFLVSTGRRELGLAEMTKAHDIDPISQLPNVIAVVAFYLARDYDAAIKQGNRTIELYSTSDGVYDWLGYAYEKRGLNDQEIAA